jgi:hypothetical protein
MNSYTSFQELCLQLDPESMVMALYSSVCDDLQTTCGDGHVSGNEACDLGLAGNSDQPGAICRTDCSEAGCGDEIIDPGEDCDAGRHNGKANHMVHCTSQCTNVVTANNDELAQGIASIPWGSWQDGEVPRGEMIRYDLWATAHHTYQMETDGQTLTDTVLQLIDPDGSTVISENDDDERSDGSLSFIEWTASHDGHYYVDVGGFGSDSGTCSFKVTDTAQNGGAGAFQTA